MLFNLDSILKEHFGNFPGGPVVKTSNFQRGGMGLIPSQRIKIPCATWPEKQNIKQNQYCNTFNKDFKSEPH